MCECIKNINKKLLDANLNTKLKTPFTMSDTSKCVVGTEKADINTRKKPTTVFASFCPFCGVEYQTYNAWHELPPVKTT